MTQYTALQVADTWIAAGGPKSRAVEWTAIALGESSYVTDAVSSAGAIGLWQIMPFNAAPHGYTVADLYNPLDNAKVAVAMSGGGVNCAAWDSCYKDIYLSGRYQFLGWPEVGSVDYANIAVVSVQLGHDKLGGGAPPPPNLPGNGFAQAVAQIDQVLQHAIPGLARQLLAQRQAVNRAFTPGWRP